jgi:DNA-binding response OmpR family regulator
MSKKILLIEDMKGVRESLEVILSIQGYQVEFASDGREGLDKAKEFTYDLIITDILMPELDGTEVIIQMRESGDKTPVLAISAGGDGVSAAQALTIAQEKADAVLEKPFSKEELIKHIKQLIG